MGQIEDRRGIPGYSALFIMIFTCVLPYIILWFMLDLDTRKPMFSILLISVTVIGYAVWNMICTRLLDREYRPPPDPDRCQRQKEGSQSIPAPLSSPSSAYPITSGSSHP
ncbi:MAG: hypothetical protein JXJ17_00195 [Anaerolineae bacterium]|nr:hypothetical protein [Anaerolineae bacterium]